MSIENDTLEKAFCRTYPNSDSMDISNWVFKDDNGSNTYTIPQGTNIQGDGYIVIVRDINNFSDYFPEITNIIGEFDFGLSRRLLIII